MARELGMTPKTLGQIDNADQEPWKLPLPAFIESLYHKRYGKDRPDVVYSIEERAAIWKRKRQLAGKQSVCGGRARRRGSDEDRPPTQQYATVSTNQQNIRKDSSCVLLIHFQALRDRPISQPLALEF